MIPYLLTAISFFILGGLVARYCYTESPRILADHDPNKPFTSAELRSIGIIPPEHYDEWLEEFARR